MTKGQTHDGNYHSRPSRNILHFRGHFRNLGNPCDHEGEDMMTHATHTQGPWSLSKPSGIYIDAPTGCIAALTYGATKADAHLIAAAPDLLAALVNCLDLIEDEGLDELHGDLAEVVRDAINKAKGA